MNSIVNPQPPRRGRFIATSTSVAGFILLLASTIATLTPNFIAFGYPILIAGIVLAFIGCASRTIGYVYLYSTPRWKMR
jgi:hypothetical protein